MSDTTPVQQSPRRSGIDILIVTAASLVAFALEILADSTGLVNVGEVARGGFAVVVGAVAALAVVRGRGGSWADLGFKRPARWATVPLWVAGILVAFVVGQILAQQLVSLFIELPEPDFSRYDSIAGNLPAALALALVLPLTASIPEEIIYRGFIIGRLEAIFASTTVAPVLAVAVQSILFGLIHFQWGVGGMFVTVILGAIWGTGYLLCGRNLWIVIMAHSAGHVWFVAQLYLS
ncbi:MAG: CPBP family intramembrane metalloprotease [Trueperaceae bacterium]|nr:MAG: CPBP family intramembrane metalloprotease [Trueperaceae bacterium]